MCEACSKSDEQMEPTDNKVLRPCNEGHVGSSLEHTVSSQQGTAWQDSSIPQGVSLSSHTDSPANSDSFASSCSERSVNVDPLNGCNSEQDRSERCEDVLHEEKSESRLLEQEVDQKKNHKDDKNGFVPGNLDNSSSCDANDDNSRRKDECADEENEPSATSDVEDEIWDPPDRENEEDDQESLWVVPSVCDIDDEGDNHESSMAVANLDDDKDGCTDSDIIELQKANSLNSSMEKVSKRQHLEKEIQRELIEVMNGKFRDLVSQLLEKTGVDSCDMGNESWVDIVTNLAWEAASFVKPDTREGKPMDPAGYVNVKCIATGSRSGSKLVKGLVFKKHAAHKHMPTEHKKPKLLLIRGMLGHSSVSSGLSSISSVADENKDLINNLQESAPNVILVEKSASRMLLEKLLQMQITVVLDMKLDSLERVARCTGSPILSSDTKFDQNLKCCESIHFEKFLEELANVAEGEKKPSKTLMFLEGTPMCQGCSILLMGSCIEELKKIKHVTRCAVVMAYHFILETAFLVHQKAMFSTIASDGANDNSLADEQSLFVVSEASGTAHDGQPTSSSDSVTGDNERSSQVLESATETASSCVLETPVCGADHEENCNGVKGTAVKPEDADNTELFSDGQHDVYDPHPEISDVLMKLYRSSPTTFKQMTSYFGLSGGQSELHTLSSVSAPPTEKPATQDAIYVKISQLEEKPVDNNHYQPLSTLCEAAGDASKVDDDGEDYIQTKDEVSSILDSESILVLMSSRNASRGTICEQSHLSHIKFYRNFDVPLGIFLRDSLFNQSLHCKVCGELPEAHIYYYAHHNKQLTIRVKRLVTKKLPGESVGKLWMWSRCGKCEPEKQKTTKRVLISTAASGLSFGKFLEISFSSQSSINRLSSCGHSLQKDFLYFFGLGSMVAVFRYSRVAIYTVSVPALKLELNGSVDGEWLHNEIENLRSKVILLFDEISSCLKKLESRFSGSNLVLDGLSYPFARIVEVLNEERSKFEENINTAFKNNNSSNSVCILLKLNRIRWDILLEACVWEKRLQLLLSSSSNLHKDTTINGVVQRHMDSKEKIGDEGGAKEGKQTAPEKLVQVQVVLREHKEVGDTQDALDMKNMHNQEALGKIQDGQTMLKDQTAGETEGMLKVADSELQRSVIEGKESSEYSTQEEVQVKTVSGSEKCPDKELPSEGMIDGNRTQDRVSSNVTGSDFNKDSNSAEFKGASLPSHVHPKPKSILLPLNESEDAKPKADKKTSETHLSLVSSFSEDSQVWRSFKAIQEECMMELQKGFIPKFGYFPKFELLRQPDFSDKFAQMITEEASRLHIPLKENNYIISDYDGEFSTSVACAVAHWNELVPDFGEDSNLKRANTEPKDGSLKQYNDPNMLRTLSTILTSETSASIGSLHPEVNLGAEICPPKGKYSVVILYAKSFRALRKLCGASELDYIASLSRCKIWDAKGGKSKSVFAKTLDGRFIIKEIKKTEYDSFMKFADKYFEYMEQSFILGNQTCLAKILGIYQVTIRHSKSGKETKHDLMVQENLSFGRNITRQYDLKGALHARFTATADGTGDVLLDQNFVNDMNSSPLYVGQKAKRLLQRAVWNDTTFLTSINVMDYSLLVGVDRQRKVLMCGIIDYLRQYTWDKQLETWVKTSLVTPKNMLPTIISPKEYKKRFRKFMDTHFLTVPDNWCSQRSSNPCKLCGIRSGDSSPVKFEKQTGQVNGFHAHD